MEGKDEEADPRRFSPLDFPSAARATFFDERECTKEDEDEEQQGQHRHPVELLHHHNDLRQQDIFYNSMEGRIRNALHQQERRSRLVRDRLEFNISPPAIPRTATRTTNLFPLVEHLEQQQVGQFDEQAVDRMNTLPSPAVTSSQHPYLAERETSFSSLTTPRNSSGGSVTRRCSYDAEASGSRVTPLNLSSQLPISAATGPVSYSSAANQYGGAAIGTDRTMTQNVHDIHTLNSMRSENSTTYATVGGSFSAFTSSRRSLPSQYPRQIPAYEASPDNASPSTLTDEKHSARVTMPSSSFINISQPSSTLGSPFSPLVMGSSQLLPQNVPAVFTPVLAEDTAATTDELMFCLPVSTNDSIQHGMTTLSSPSRNRPSSGMSSIDETLSSSTETETIGRGRSIPRQSRRATRRGSRGRVPSPGGRGRSSSSHLSGSSRKDRGRSTPSPASFASGNTVGDDNFVGEQEKSPPPQNLRGDPFRSAKVKTELCRNYNSAKGCPFGDKCNYAHGEHELKFTKLMDLERAGLVDVEIFRTHPCPTWVATGACPFDQRCLGLHDPRVKSSRYSSWLPHAETMINKVATGVNVDSFYHERVASAYNLCPVYGYVPQVHRNSSDTEFMNEASFKHFYEHVCNLERLKYQEVTSIGNALDEDIVLEIVLKLRAEKAGVSYRYIPTHMLRGELCMVLQTKTFESRKSYDESMSHRQSLLYEVTEPSPDANSDGTRIIKVYEIAFGPVGDPSARNVSVWFDLQEDDLIECTPQQAKHHKRSRHRLKTAKRTKGAKFALNVDDDLCKGLILPFEHYQPRDKCAFDLVTKILRLRLRTIYVLRDIAANNTVSLMYRGSTSNYDYDYVRSNVQQLDKEIKDLNRSYSSQLRHWITWSWPEQVLGHQIDDETDVPPVDSEYEFHVYKSEFKRGDSDNLYGLGSIRSIFNLSDLSLHLPSLVWKSFMENISTQNDISVAKSTVANEKNYFIVNRLPVLQILSMGREINNKRTLPRLFQTPNLDSGNQVDSFQSFLDSWDATKKHFEEKLASHNISKEEIVPKES